MNKTKIWLSSAVTVVLLTLASLACSGCNPKDKPQPNPNDNPNNQGNTGNNTTPGDVNTLDISATSLTLMVNESKQLVARPNNDANLKFVSWSSSDAGIVKVTPDGTVTGVSEGKAVVTASAGKLSANCNVTVKGTKNVEPLNVTITGKIDHNVHTPGQTGQVVFNRFPASVAEFTQVREKIGGEPHGAIALQIMAMEMYRRDRAIGTECLKLNNTTTNVKGCLDRLKELFGTDVSYARPYQAAAFLSGATPDNGYKPNEPYTINIEVRGNRPYQETSIYQSKVLAFFIECAGRKDGKVGIEVLKTKKPGESSNGKYFIVFNCPDTYFQVEPISFDATFDGLK